MRLALIILLIALAPLRGLAGELMATRMAVGLAAGAVDATHQQTPHANGHHCEEMAPQAAAHQPAVSAEQTDTTGAGAAVATDGGCENCSLCQMCASAALPVTVPVALVTPGTPLALDAGAYRFASATTALAQKPPIS